MIFLKRWKNRGHIEDILDYFYGLIPLLNFLLPGLLFNTITQVR